MCQVFSTLVAGTCACATSLGAQHGPFKFAKWGKKGGKKHVFCENGILPETCANYESVAWMVISNVYLVDRVVCMPFDGFGVEIVFFCEMGLQ